MADDARQMNLTPQYLWSRFRGWWTGLKLWARAVLAIAVVAGIGGILAQVAGPSIQGPVLGSVIRDGTLSIVPSSGSTVGADTDLTLTVGLTNPSRQNIGAVTAVVKFNPNFLTLDARECASSTDTACINLVASSFAKALPGDPGFTVVQDTAATSTITISRGMDVGWFTNTEGVVAVLRFRTSATSKGSTKVRLDLGSSSIGVPRDTGRSLCYDGYSTGKTCPARGQNSQDCPLHDPSVLQCGTAAQSAPVIRAPRLVPEAQAAPLPIEVGVCAPPSRVPNCQDADDCQEFGQCGAEFIAENILTSVSSGTYIIGGLSCAELSGITDGSNVCSVGQKTCDQGVNQGKPCVDNTGCPLSNATCSSAVRTCSNDPSRGCGNNNDCPLHNPANLVCKLATHQCVSPPTGAECFANGDCQEYGVCMNTCAINNTIQCTSNVDCQEYGVCQGVSNVVCLGTEYPDIDPASVCCSQACTQVKPGQLYIQNVVAGTAAVSGTDVTESLSWTVLPPAAGRSLCDITFTKTSGPGGVPGTRSSNANSNHAISAVIPGVTAPTAYNYTITCSATGYTVGVYTGKFVVGQAQGGTLRIERLVVGNVSLGSVQVTYGTTIDALGTVAVQRTSCAAAGSPPYTTTASDTTPVSSHRSDISFPPFTSVCTYAVTVTATGGGQTATATTTFTSPAQTALAPNANVIMKVTKDRVCKNWFFCQSSVRMKNQQGKQEDLCFDLGACDTLDSNGQCINPVASPAVELTFPTPSQVSYIKEMSGMVKAGLEWNPASTPPQVIRGYYPYRGMSEVGRIVKVPNGNMESGQAAPWRRASCTTNSTSCASLYNFRNTADSNNPSYVLKVVPGINAWSGAVVPLGPIFYSDQPYILTFRARADGTSGKTIAAQLMIESGNPPVATPYTFAPPAGAAALTLTPSWRRYQLRLASPQQSGSTVLQFVQPPESTSRDAFYLDDVAIQPVLEVRGGDTPAGSPLTILRTCRLYPKPDAPACDFLDLASGKEFVGWKGYCVERQDPNPALADDPSNDCLLWWPVDVLAGSADLFAGEVISGYKGRKPLYYCLDSKGDWPYYERQMSGYHETATAKDGGKDYSFNVSSLGIFKDELLEVRVNGVDMDHDGDRDWDCEIIADRGPSGPDSHGADGYIVLNQENKEHWEDGFNVSKPLGKDCDNNGSTSINPYAYVRCHKGDPDNDCNTTSARLTFNNHRVLQEIQVRYRDGSPGKGMGKFNSVTMTFRGERCNVLAQVVTPDGDAVPWTSRITPGGWIKDNYAKYSYAQDFEPYGGAVPPGGANTDPGDPSTWNVAAYVEAPIMSGTLTKPYQYRAGSPYGIAAQGQQCTLFESNTDDRNTTTVTYGCGGSVPTSFGRVCITGSTDRLGKECVSNPDCGFALGGSNAPGICAGIDKPSDSVITWSLLYGALRPGPGQIPAERGRDNIGNLFIRSYGIWGWGYDGTQYRYMKCNGKNNPPDTGCIADWDFRGDSRNAVDAPRVTAIEVDAPPIIKRAAGVKLRFTTAVNGDHLPLVGFRIDWGDGKPITEVGGLRINPRSSMEDPHVALHTYQCTGTSACVYWPSVQVIDNWGWCNGGYGSACAVTPQQNPAMWTRYANPNGIKVNP